jgi:predicted RNase H-like HicB family nuclease
MSTTNRYLVILEQGPTGFGAYSPDVPGCFAVGKTEDETLRRFVAALKDHLAILAEEGQELPRPVTQSRMVDVRVPISA